jgi:hypothetical protein
MKVDKINAVVRYSLDTGHGWKSLELGCEASVDERENWQTAQATLYGQLAQQFKALWSQPAPAQAGGATPQVKEAHQESHQTCPEQGRRMPVQAPQTPTPPTDRPHFCVEHNQEWAKKNGPHGEFFSHPIGGGNEKGSKSWCNESKK